MPPKKNTICLIFLCYWSSVGHHTLLNLVRQLTSVTVIVTVQFLVCTWFLRLFFLIIYGFIRFLFKYRPTVHRYKAERLNFEVRLKVSDKRSSFQHHFKKNILQSTQIFQFAIFSHWAVINSPFIFIKCKEHLSMLKIHI